MPLLLEDASRGNKMQVDEALALPSQRWPVCQVEHPEGATNSNLIPDGQQFSVSFPVFESRLIFGNSCIFSSAIS